MLVITRNVGDVTQIGDLSLELTSMHQDCAAFLVRHPDGARRRNVVTEAGEWKLSEDVRIIYLQNVHMNKMRLGIEAPRHIPIVRDDARKRESRDD